MALMKIVDINGNENIVDVDVPLSIADNSVTETDIQITGGTETLTIEVPAGSFAAAADLTSAAADELIVKIEEGVNDPYHIPEMTAVDVPTEWERKNMHAQDVYQIEGYTIT